MEAARDSSNLVDEGDLIEGYIASHILDSLREETQDELDIAGELEQYQDSTTAQDTENDDTLTLPSTRTSRDLT